MKYDLKFPLKILITVAIVGLIGAYPLAVYANGEFICGVLAGCILGVLNVFVGFLCIEYAFDKPNTVFLKTVLGGMGIRLLVIAAVLVVLLRVLRVDMYGLVFSFFFFYVVFAILEILFLNKKISLKRDQ